MSAEEETREKDRVNAWKQGFVVLSNYSCGGGWYVIVEFYGGTLKNFFFRFCSLYIHKLDRNETKQEVSFMAENKAAPPTVFGSHFLPEQVVFIFFSLSLSFQSLTKAIDLHGRKERTAFKLK